MMSYLGWPTLKSRRTNAKLIMLYKIINNIVDIDLDGDLLMSSASHYTRSHFIQPYTRVDANILSYHQQLNSGTLYHVKLSIRNQLTTFKISCSHIILICN